MTTTFRGYLAPAYRGDALAIDWEAYLAFHCDWSVEAFGGGYAWAAPVPPRATWAAEVQALNAHLAAEGGRDEQT